MEEFKCGNLTSFGCDRMSAVKELMALNNEGICTNICCNNCDKFHNCAYKCNQADSTNMDRAKNHIGEELHMEMLLGIKCYNCKNEINQQGHIINIISEETDCIWLCNECWKKVGGRENKKDHKQLKLL